mmetsp:Transcript_12459/g.29146  ORF Transcript_12459/g.29146 Transcript_12459/m.29146 type:complete len:98 (-) Transcript_12459:312-605(-)
MAARPQDHDVFGNPAPAHVPRPGSELKPKDSDIFGTSAHAPRRPARGSNSKPADSNIFAGSDNSSSLHRQPNSTGRNILDSSLDLGSGYPEPPPVGK